MTGTRRRGPGKRDARWTYKGPKSVAPLELDLTANPATRRSVERLFEDTYSLRRAVQRDAIARIKAYETATHERKRSVERTRFHKGLPVVDTDGVIQTRTVSGHELVRERVGLTQDGFAAAAKQHLDESNLTHYVSKAVGAHIAAQVWQPVHRYLFPDKTGKRFGKPGVTRWYDFRRIPGRAKSHTAERKWETFRLVGSLDGHVVAYGDGRTVADLLTVPPGNTILRQPRHMPVPMKPTSGWWNYNGPLAVVYTNGSREIVMPIRLPASSGQFPHVAHYLADETLWHKIDLVRVQDRAAPGGWRYHAHLMILGASYLAPSTVERRATTPTGRVACMDVNVSNIAVASMPANPASEADEPMLVSHLPVTDEELAAAARAAAKQRGRQRALDRSRRNSNPNEYALSRRQQVHAARRAAANLPTKQSGVHTGPRHSNAAGVPTRAYRRDVLSPAYRRNRAKLAEAAHGMSVDKDRLAARVAATIVAVHGANILSENVTIAGWFGLWGKRLQVTTPGRLRAAITAEALACGGALLPIGTNHTALSQHCVCGLRAKKPLSQRVHSCDCGFIADRDVVSAVVGTAVVFNADFDPASARIDLGLLAAAQRRSTCLFVTAQENELVQSTAPSITLFGDGRDGSDSGEPVSPLLNKRVVSGHTPEQTTLARRRRRTRLATVGGETSSDYNTMPTRLSLA